MISIVIKEILKVENEVLLVMSVQLWILGNTGDHVKLSNLLA